MDSPAELQRIAKELEANSEDISEEVIDHWCSIGEVEQWLAVPDGLSYDHLPDLIATLAGAALESNFEDGPARRLVEAAARHGEHRRGDGLEKQVLFQEYHLLRRSIWTLIRDRFGEDGTTLYASMRLDSGIGLATGASLHGYHRAELEAQDRWPDALEQMLKSWPGFDSDAL